MTDTQAPPETPTAKPKTQPAPSGPTVRSVVYGGLAVCAVAGAAAAFALGGWIALAGFGGAALVAPAAARRVVKGPQGRKNPGSLASLLKARRGSTSSKRGQLGIGKLPWSLTGNQSKRAKTGRTGTGTTGGKGLGKRLGLGKGKTATGKTTGPKLGARRTPRLATGQTPKARGSVPRLGAQPRPLGARPVPKRPTALKTTPKAAKPTGGAATRRTQPRPGGTNRGLRTPKLTSPAGTRRTTGRKGNVSRPATRGTLPKSPKLSTPGRGTPKTPTLRGGTGGRRRAGRSNLRTARRLGTGGSSRGRLGTSKRGGFSGAGRGPTTPRTRRAPKPTTGNPPPKRVVRHRTPKRQSVPRLIRTGLRVPKRGKGLRFTRPTKTRGKTARRTLTRMAVRGTARAGWGLTRWSGRKTGNWFRRLDERARGLTAPMPLPDGTIVIPATPPKTEADIRRKYSPAAKKRRHRAAYPDLTRRRKPASQPTTTTGATTTMQTTDAVVDAFAQLANFDPENATEILELFDSLPGMFAEAAASLTAQVSRLSSEQPIQAAVTDVFSQVAAAMAGLSDLADDANSTLNTVHAEDIARMRGERGLNNEQAWDVGRN